MVSAQDVPEKHVLLLPSEHRLLCMYEHFGDAFIAGVFQGVKSQLGATTAYLFLFPEYTSESRSSSISSALTRSWLKQLTVAPSNTNRTYAQHRIEELPPDVSASGLRMGAIDALAPYMPDSQIVTASGHDLTGVSAVHEYINVTTPDHVSRELLHTAWWVCFCVYDHCHVYATHCVPVAILPCIFSRPPTTPPTALPPPRPPPRLLVRPPTASPPPRPPPRLLVRPPTALPPPRPLLRLFSRLRVACHSPARRLPPPYPPPRLALAPSHSPYKISFSFFSLACAGGLACAATQPAWTCADSGVAGLDSEQRAGHLHPPGVAR